MDVSTRRQCPGRPRGGGRADLLFPGIPAEAGHVCQLRAAELKGAGHRTYLRRSLRDTASLDCQPFGPLHASQPGCLLHRTAPFLAVLLDEQAEQLAPDLAVDPIEVLLTVNWHTYIHITPYECRLSSKIGADLNLTPR